MATNTPTISSGARLPIAAPNDLIWRLSVEQYHEMARAGILTEDDPVELLEGWLVYKMTKKPPHTISTTLTRQSLERIVPAGWFVNSQEPITLEDSEPEPDVVIVRGEPRNYKDHHPGAEDVALVVEVSDSTLGRDRGTKRRIYARAGIAVYWLINLIENRVEVYTNPTGATDEPDYQQQQVFSASDTLSLMIEDQEVGLIAVKDLLP